MTRVELSGGDGGFALVDALFAAALLAFAGTVIAAIGANLLQAQDDKLRRSSALVTLDMTARILRAEGMPAASLLVPVDDQNFHFEISSSEQATGQPHARWIRLEAHPTAKRIPPYTIDLFVPDGSP